MNHQRLSKYLKLDRLIKRMEKEKDMIRQEIIAAASDSTTFPSTYDVTVKTHMRRQVESLDAIKDKSQKVYDALVTIGAIKEIEQTRVTVKRKE